MIWARVCPSLGTQQVVDCYGEATYAAFCTQMYTTHRTYPADKNARRKIQPKPKKYDLLVTMMGSRPSTTTSSSNTTAAAADPEPPTVPSTVPDRSVTRILTGSLAVRESPWVAAAAARDGSPVIEGDPMSSSRDNHNHHDDAAADDTIPPLGEVSAAGNETEQATKSKILPTTSTSPISMASSTHTTGDSKSKNSDNNSHNDDNQEDIEDDEDDGEQNEEDEVKSRGVEEDAQLDEQGEENDEQPEEAEDRSRDVSLHKEKKNKKPKKEKKLKLKRPPSTKASNPDTTSHVPRDDTSLGVLARKFLRYMQSSSTGVVDLNDLAVTFNVPKRRIYDITTVVEGTGLIKKCSKNVIAWTGPLDKDDDDGDGQDEDDNDQDDDEEKKSSRTLTSEDEEEEEDDEGQSTWKVSRVRDEVQAYYNEETLLDTWISRLRRVLQGQTNLSCDASDIVHAIFHPAETTTTTSPSMSSLIDPSNFLDETGNVQWSLLAIHAPHGSLMQVASQTPARTRNPQSDCRMYISTKVDSVNTQPEDDYDYYYPDERDADIDPVSNADVVPDAAVNEQTGDNDVDKGVSIEESGDTSMVNGEAGNGKHPVDHLIETGNSNDRYEEPKPKAPKRQRRDDNKLEIFLLPTTYNRTSCKVQLLAGCAKSIPDPLPPVYASAVAATAPSTNPTVGHVHTKGHSITNGSSSSNKIHNAPTVEDYQSWNFVSQLTHREGVSDFFADPPQGPFSV